MRDNKKWRETLFVCGQECVWSSKAIDHRAREFAERGVIYLIAQPSV
jgi:hypothetical protein